MKIGRKSILDGDQSENVSMIRIVLDLEKVMFANFNFQASFCG
jgi:hypothetical protein